MLKWIPKNSRPLHCVEKETRDATVVWHELAEHTLPNTACSRRGSAVAISATLSSVKLKAQPPMGEQADVSLRKASSRNSTMGDMKAVSMMTLGLTSRLISLATGPCLSEGCELCSEEVRRMVVVKKVSHSNEPSSPSERYSSRGKMLCSDKLGALGGLLAMDSTRRLGSCIICWTAVSDKGKNVDRLSRVGPH